MNISFARKLRGGLCAAALAAGSVVAAPDGDMHFNAMLEQFNHLTDADSSWQNTHMAWGNGENSSESADSIVAMSLRTYDREVLDRGHWVNPWVEESGYASGNPLLAVARGSGVTERVA